MMVVHLARMGAVILLAAVCMFRPFLPGAYDSLAVTLSFMAQTVGIAGLLLVPVGALWLVEEVRGLASGGSVRPTKGRGYYYAIASLAAASIVAAAVSLAAFAKAGLSFGLITLALWIYCLLRIAPGLKLLKQAEKRSFNPAPLHLICVPIAVLLLRLALVAPAVEFSRNYAIRQSAELINDIEAYYDANGHYPSSLASVWQDYKPSVAGIERFYYEPNGDAYNVFFEQFTFQLDTREIVVYNKHDEQAITSHDSWILALPPEDLEAGRGYYAVHETGIPHWKYFWFD